MEEVAVPEVTAKPAKLTAENLDAVSRPSKAPSVASKKGKKAGARPAWANTEAQMEEAKEAEIDELLEFAYELDYEKYMEDYEVRQALAIIKDRVNEITADPDWKQQISNEWNEANQQEAEERRAARRQAQADETRSQVTYRKFS